MTDTTQAPSLAQQVEAIRAELNATGKEHLYNSTPEWGNDAVSILLARIDEVLAAAQIVSNAWSKEYTELETANAALAQTNCDLRIEKVALNAAINHINSHVEELDTQIAALTDALTTERKDNALYHERINELANQLAEERLDNEKLLLDLDACRDDQ